MNRLEFKSQIIEKLKEIEPFNTKINSYNVTEVTEKIKKNEITIQWLRALLFNYSTLCKEVTILVERIPGENFHVSIEKYMKKEHVKIHNTSDIRTRNEKSIYETIEIILDDFNEKVTKIQPQLDFWLEDIEEENKQSVFDDFNFSKILDTEQYKEFLDRTTWGRKAYNEGDYTAASMIALAQILSRNDKYQAISIMINAVHSINSTC